MALQDELAPYGDEVDLVRDRALVARSQAGDGSAFAELYTRYHDRLQRFCYRRLHDKDEAADVTQEAFTRAWRALPRFAGERRFYPWLTVIAGNLCTDLLRKRARSQPTDDIEALGHRERELPAVECTEDSVMAAVDGELVARALNRLSKRHQRVLAMREAAGFTYQEIAIREGVEISTIETLLWRARQALKREYGALSGGALGVMVLAGATVRRFGARLSRRLSLVPLGRGGGMTGSLAAVVTSAVVATVVTLPPATGSQGVAPAAAVVQATGASHLNGVATQPSVSGTEPAPLPVAEPSPIAPSPSSTAPARSTTGAPTSASTTPKASVAATGGGASTGSLPAANIGTPSLPNWGSVISPVTTVTGSVSTTAQHAVTGVDSLVPPLAPALGAVSPTTAVTEANSTIEQATDGLTTALSVLGGGT